ncbi:hypothetical protein JCM10212_006663 [Sporobolomyces blumeae]
MPLLSPTSTLLVSGAFSASYLASIYLVPSARVRLATPASSRASDADRSATRQGEPDDLATPPVEHRDRNHPTVIKARLVAVSLSSISSLAAFPFVLAHALPTRYPTYSSTLRRAVQLLGLALPPTWTDAIRLVVFPLGLTASLFAGSLYVLYLEGDLPGQLKGGKWKSLKARFDGWRGIRNYVVAPLTEELTFRSCVVAASFVGGWSKNRMIFVAPLWFGLAHVHHAWESYLAGGRTRKALVQGLLVSTFQFAYTTLFGWYATYLFLQTGSIVPPFLAHSFCNMMGLPPLGWALRAHPDKKISLWTTYVAGIATFVFGFARWTRPELWGGSAYWA